MKRVFSFVLICLLCLSMFTIFAPKASASDSLVGYWKFDEGLGNVAHDSSGNGNDGTIHTATWTEGKIGNALHFNGVDSWVEIPSSPTLTALSQITLEAWIQEDSITDHLKGIIRSNEYSLSTSENGEVFFETDNGASSIFNSQTTPLITEAGRWYHVAGTWSGDSYTIYVDGAPVLSGTCTPQTTPGNTFPVEIGRHGTWGLCYFQGIIDEVKIYNYARNAQEILGDYSSVSQGPVGYWKFDEGSGNIAHDSSGNGNDGTVVDASWTNGISNGALQFDGIDDYVGVPSSSSVCVTGNQITVQLWMKPAFTLDATTPITNILDKGDEYGFQMDQTSSGRIWFFVWLQGAPWQGILTTTNRWAAGTWYHLTGTYDGNNLKVYVNGVLENSRTLSGDLYTSSFPLAIGSYCLGTMNFFNGAIDEVKIYNYARAVTEVPRPPSPPRNLAAKSYEYSVVLSWEEPSDPGSSSVSEYKLYRGPSPGNEVFLATVSGSTLSFADSSVSTLQYYYVTAKNLDGRESERSNEVKCSSGKGVKGIETVVKINDFQTTNNKPFSLQQNFFIPLGDAGNYYWVQNIVLVKRVAVQGGYLWRMTGGFEIWKYTNYVAEWPQKVFFVLTQSAETAYKNTIVLRSGIDNDRIVMQNDAHDKWTWDTLLPTDSYILQQNPSPQGWESPEIVMTGVPPLFGDATVEFGSNTNGYVDTYVRVGTGTWLPGSNIPIESPNNPSTAERSRNLDWETNGDFQYRAAWTDQGLGFVPNYLESIVTPPDPSLPASRALTISLFCPANLSLFNSFGQHTGFNTTTQQIDVNVPSSSLFIAQDFQSITVFDPSGDHGITVLGTGQGNYALIVVLQNETGSTLLSWNSTESISNGQEIDYTVSSNAEPKVISWECVFKDSRRGTVLKISTDDKYFQFTAPGKDFGVEYDPKMIVLKNVIAICYNDSTMRLVAVAVVGKTSFCTAVAWDKQTGKMYLLLDYPGRAGGICPTK